MASNEVVESGVIVGAVTVCYAVTVSLPAHLRSQTTSCFILGDSLFFPPDYSLKYNKQIERARAVCRECPVFDACHEWAVARPDLEGIWAATTPLERRRIRKQRKEDADRALAAEEISA